MSLIRVEELCKTYKMGNEEVRALKNTFLTIAEGEFVAIIGTSGSGKSTLLTILGLMAGATSGKYFFDGVDISKKSDDYYTDLRNTKIGYVFQEFNLLHEITAIENVMLPLYYSGKYSRSQLKKKALSCLAIVGLEDRAYHRPSELSGGQKQRVAIARSLITDPKVIIADEPTGALDQKSTVQILGILQQLNRDRRTVIVVTHDSNVASHAKRIVRIHDGAIVSDEMNFTPRIAPVWNLNPSDTQIVREDAEAGITKEVCNYVDVVSALNIDERDNILLDLCNRYLSNSVVLKQILTGVEENSLKGAVICDIIKKTLASKAWDVSSLALKQIQLLLPEDASKYISNILSSETNTWVQYSALVALLRSNTTETLNSIKEFIASSDEKIRATVAAIAKKTSFFEAKNFNDEKWNVIYSIIDSGLKDKDARVLANTVELIEVIWNFTKNQEDYYKKILDHINHSNNRVAGNVIMFLWRQNKNIETCILRIKALAKSSNVLDRHTCIYVLENILKNEYSEELVALLLESQSENNKSITDKLKKALNTILDKNPQKEKVKNLIIKKFE